MRKSLFAGLIAIFGFPVAAEPVVIAALGDSLIHGYGLREEDGFVPRMQAWLNDQGADVRLINAGVSGDTTAGGAARIGWTLTPDVDGLIVTLGGNDVLRGIDPAASRANLDQILTIARDADVEVLLIGMQAPGNYGVDYKASFDAIYPELAGTYDVLYVESFFAGLDVGDDLDAARNLLQPDGIHPNVQGVALIVDALGPSVLDLAMRTRN